MKHVGGVPFFCAAAFIALGAPDGRAETVTVPVGIVDAQAPGFPSDVVVLEVTLPPVRQGAGLVVQAAHLEWTCNGAAARVRTEFWLFEAVGAGSPPARGDVSPESEPVGVARVFSRDIRRLGRPIVRFDVRDIVQVALDHGRSQLRLGVKSGDIAARDLMGTGSPPTLQLRYGFLGNSRQAFRSSH